MTGPKWKSPDEKTIRRIPKQEYESEFYITHDVIYKPKFFGKPPPSSFPDKRLKTTDNFRDTGFAKKTDQMNKTSMNYSGARYMDVQNTGEQATTIPDTYTMERSSSNWAERVERSARYKHLKKAKPHIKAPDFKKLLSREYLEKLHEDKRNVIPFSLPKYHYTQASI